MVTPPGSDAAVVAVAVRRLDAAGARQETDRLAVEAPLEIRLDGVPFTVLMRTPGDDHELVAGFLFTEGIVTDAGGIAAMARPAALPGDDCDNFLEVRLAPGVARPAERTFYASASCGVCGKNSIADLAVRAPAVESGLTIGAERIAAMPGKLLAAQTGFAATGGLHAAGLFDATGELVAVREDVGRHNAVDKLVGWALGAGKLPLSDSILAVSGRLGFEIVQKAIVAGVPVIAAVGAASTLAVSLAESHRLTLASFVREGRMNLFGEVARVTGTAATR
jgi:FdhD protein